MWEGAQGRMGEWVLFFFGVCVCVRVCVCVCVCVMKLHAIKFIWYTYGKTILSAWHHAQNTTVIEIRLKSANLPQLTAVWLHPTFLPFSHHPTFRQRPHNSLSVESCWFIQTSIALREEDRWTHTHTQLCGQNLELAMLTFISTCHHWQVLMKGSFIFNPLL